MLTSEDAVDAADRLDRADAVSDRIGSRAWSALIAGSRARILRDEEGDETAQAWLDRRLDALCPDGSAAHPAFTTARRALSVAI